MRVPEMHPLCCISLESPGIGDRSPLNFPTIPAQVSGGSDIKDGKGPGSSANVAGVLYKWTNYGKGWRTRWFSLRNGVLSYSKIRRFDNVVATSEEVRVIGKASVRLVGCSGGGSSSSSGRRKQQKTVGVVHLKISSFRESKSDDKRFYIFTATKTLHLRTDSRKDRVAWIDALVSARSLFSVRLLNNKISFIHNDVSLSTEKLRERLLRDGLDEVLIKDCEQIMRSEFSELQGQLKLLCDERSNLIDTLRQLEATNVEVEPSGIHEVQFQLMKHEISSPGHGKYSECSTTESSDDIEKQEPEEVSDEDETSYFDTKEFFSDSLVTCGSIVEATNSVNNSVKAENCFDFVGRMHLGVELSNCKYPCIERRKKLPDPIEKEKGVSLWSMIKDNVGKDLTRVCLPVYFNEPLSSLQKCFEDMEYSYLLDRAYEYGKMVSHHPMLIACHCEGKGWKFWGDSNIRSKFWGRSIQLDPVGVLTLEFDDGEIFQWSKVTTTIYNLILGKVYCDHHGTMNIRGNGQYSCMLKFKEQSILDRNPRQVHGFVEDVMGTKVATLLGKWDDSIYYINGDGAARPKGCDPLSDAFLLWRRSKPPTNLSRYNLSSFAITLNELTSGLQEKLPPTDSRLRPDQRYLENGEYEKADAEKLRLERRQRMSRKLQESGWKPRWFRKDSEDGSYHYVGGYWEAREKKEWNGCPHIFDEISRDATVNSSQQSGL
ncbi:oxysterol-binding protein-related protein 2A-like isoform X2 [Magnolia sinica]|uniref:oxysterol-binding protein-related protein 2A-like isoform X2 n=1 Tax=Magnolia sinica TaxID=86752 RepID=UPI0026583438|nr:oxysterol-binding protein-related protein 2A-like isoform X2 [Magnolia sinica]